MRLVLDTCVIVSAFRSRSGASFRLLELLKERRFVAIATSILLFEYEAVLKRPEHRIIHGLSDELLETAIRVLADRIEPVIIDFQWKPALRDPNDDKVLESAINGHADAIITHNIRDFQPGAAEFGIPIIGPSAIIKERFS